MKNRLFIICLLILLILLIILVKLLINNYNKEVCYNMPLNKFVEEERCNKFTINDFINGGGLDVNK